MFEFIYQTYLEDEPDKHDHYEVVLLIQFGFAGLFIFDWCLNLFLADHRGKYITRSVSTMSTPIIDLKQFVSVSTVFSLWLIF